MDPFFPPMPSIRVWEWDSGPRPRQSHYWCEERNWVNIKITRLINQSTSSRRHSLIN
ncbi:hypothetical protein B0F90DRAFT_1737448, partial [Multifurca ochricompacta]